MATHLRISFCQFFGFLNATCQPAQAWQVLLWHSNTPGLDRANRSSPCLAVPEAQATCFRDVFSRYNSSSSSGWGIAQFDPAEYDQLRHKAMHMLAMLTGLIHVVVVQPASQWWHRNIVMPRQLQHEGRSSEGKVSFEAVPGCPGFLWATDPSLRLIASSGPGNVH